MQGVRAANRVALLNVTITNSSSHGVEAANNYGSSKASLKGCTVTGNAGSGVIADKSVLAIDSTITNNGLVGIVVEPQVSSTECQLGHISLKNTTVTGNGTDASCGVTLACADVYLCPRPPKLIRGSSCDHSCKDKAVPCESWNVCSLD